MGEGGDASVEILAASWTLMDVLNITYTALGLGFVIFVHELGHFAVAKWCGVRVERFSIGFGPVIWSVMRGETEYALSIIPFGGYVKMLGQDDADPSQTSSEEIARDPRSYTSKTVPQRMAIISAGVIMNLVTGTMMFGLAFLLGLESQPSTVGAVSPGSPAWVAGMRPGDRITNIDGHQIQTFQDTLRRVTLSWETVEIGGVRPDGSKFQETITPVKLDNRNTIGVSPASSLKISDLPPEVYPVARKGTAAADAKPPFERGDLIQSVNKKPVKDYFEFRKALIAERGKTIDVTVLRGGNPKARPPVEGQPVTIKVGSNPMRTLGLRMDIGQVSAVRKGSPADGKLMRGDKITHVLTPDGELEAIGKDLDPLRLPEVLAGFHGKEITLQVKRERSGAEPEEIKVTLTPENRAGWSEYPFGPDSPMSIPAIGVTCYVLHSVLAVDPGSPADGLVRPKDQIKSAELILPKTVADDSSTEPPMVLDFSDGKRSWPYLFWLVQELPLRNVRLTVASGGTSRVVELEPQPAKDWFLIERGMNLESLLDSDRNMTVGKAAARGFAESRNVIAEVYIVIYNLFTGRLSIKQMHGPISIAKTGVKISNQGFAPLLYFLAYLSINLAVLNFLPIPVLDGGHMAFLAYEGIMRKPPSIRVFNFAMILGLVMLGMLMVTVLGLDIMRLFGLHK